MTDFEGRGFPLPSKLTMSGVVSHHWVPPLRSPGGRVVLLCQDCSIAGFREAQDGCTSARLERDLRLTPSEHRVLLAVASAAGCVVTADAVARSLWSDVEHLGHYERQCIRQHLLTLRRKIEPLGIQIETLMRRGYRLRLE